jgi:Flp pilus assembly protein TadD
MRRFVWFAFLVCVLTSFVAGRSAVFMAGNSFDPSGGAQAEPATRTAKAAGPEKSGDKPSVSTDAKPDYSKEPFVIERLRTQFRFENDGTGRKEVSVRVRVQTEAGMQEWGQLKFRYNSANERVEIPYVRVLKQDGSIVTAGPDAVQDLSTPVERLAPVYTDSREKHVIVPGLRPGDLLEYDVAIIIHTPLAPRQFWMQHNFNRTNIVLDEQLEVDVPGSQTAKVKSRPGMEPRISEENGRRIYHWISSHLVPEKDDKEKGQEKGPEGEPPAVQVTTFASWGEVGRWYADLEKDRRLPSVEVRAKAEELTRGLTANLEKVEALYDYVAKNVRYVGLWLGIGRYQPHAAADVLHNQYGDCKDKNTLLASLLEAEGMRSSSVLISSRRKLDPDIPSPSQFDHVITMLPLGNQEVWMDATSEVAPFQLLAYPLRKKQALVIPPDGVPHLEETPADPPMPNSIVAEIDGKLSETGKLDATVSYTIRGDAELALRSLFWHVPPTQLQRLVEGMNKSLGGEVSDVKISDLTTTREPFELFYRVSKPNFVDWSKKKSEVALPLSGFELTDAPEGEENSTDANAGPVRLGPPNERTYRIKLDLAGKYTAQAPLPITVERDYGVYRASYRVEGSVFTAERRLTTRKGELPRGRADDYRAFRRTVLEDAGQRLTIESAITGTPTLPSDLKADDLIRNGNTARKNGNYALAVDLLKRAVEIDPKSKSAWNDLGMAYLDAEQYALAIGAFQRQVEINPYDQYAYNRLGVVYLRERKYEEAEKWFRKQIDINPLDKVARANLGLVYLESHKYAEALQELQRAASITPNDATLQARIGAAYLNLGEDEKATAAFDRSAEISATPVIWNYIAYQLALRNSHLDRAKRYAESAVSATAAALRNVSLDQLNTRDLGFVASLASYWDTLGWVAFAEGKLEAAERYVSAAWQLGQRAEVADHLGQIYEKRGNKEEAACMYALAMNAHRPEPETRSRLAALLGAEDKAAAGVEKYGGQLQLERTIKLGNGNKLEGKADFFVLLGQGGGGLVKVEAVAFVSGDERLKGLTDALSSSTWHQAFPDDTPLKILRRGTLSCAATVADCTFLLALPQDVKSVD